MNEDAESKVGAGARLNAVLSPWSALCQPPIRYHLPCLHHRHVHVVS